MLVKRCPFCGRRMSAEELCLNEKCPDYKRTVAAIELAEETENKDDKNKNSGS